MTRLRQLRLLLRGVGNLTYLLPDSKGPLLTVFRRIGEMCMVYNSCCAHIKTFETATQLTPEHISGAMEGRCKVSFRENESTFHFVE